MFITHGGLLSTTEAVFRGVPIVGIPVMADQPINMQHTENAGLGITLDLDRLSEDTLYEAVTEVLTNPRSVHHLLPLRILIINRVPPYVRAI